MMVSRLPPKFSAARRNLFVKTIVECDWDGEERRFEAYADKLTSSVDSERD